MKKIVADFLLKLGYTIKIKRRTQFNRLYKAYKDYTMIPKYLFNGNLDLILNHVTNIPGDVVECGVWRGGMIASIAEILGNNRTYYLFDSFEGLPKANDIDGEEALKWQANISGDTYFDNCKAEIDFAKQAMEMTGAKHSIAAGWFNETLPNFKFSNPIALLRLDADWYDSTILCLNYLYPHVIHNGVIILDDYHTWDGCSRAVHDYLSSIKSASRISESPEGICYIIKRD